jgi:hypothetical protein
MRQYDYDRRRVANFFLPRRSCRFRFQCETGRYPIDLSGLNWDRSLGSVPIKTEDMARSGEASVWFNPTSHVLVQPFAYKKLCEKMFQRSPSSVGHVADEHDALIERTITRSTNPN